MAKRRTRKGKVRRKPSVEAPQQDASQQAHGDAYKKVRDKVLPFKDNSRQRVSRRNAHTTTKQSKALRLRAAGLTYDAIAKAAGYTDATAARRSILNALSRVLVEGVEDVRRLENLRSDYLIAAHWAKAVSGNIDSTKIVLKLMDFQARINHLYQEAPQIHVSIEGGEATRVDKPLSRMLLEDATGALAYMQALAPPEEMPKLVDAEYTVKERG